MSGSSFIRRIDDLPVEGQRCFLRLDLNVPLGDGDPRSILDDNRIVQALPTIEKLASMGAKIILASHLGRPKGQRMSEYSLEPVALALAEKLGKDVVLAQDSVGDSIELMVQKLGAGELLLLENLRFYMGEEKNEPKFANRLARLVDVYINDAFGTAHRKHASTYGLPTLIENKGMGLLIEKELKFLDPLLSGPAQPNYLLLGGAKVSDKIKAITALIPNVDGMAIGGAMAFAFLAAKGEKVPEDAKQPSGADIKAAQTILKECARKEMPVLLPVDLPAPDQPFDIGPKTIERFSVFLRRAKTVFWNGPLGWFEKEEFARGTRAIAGVLAESAATKIVGGGETVAAVRASGLADRFDHLSTGGGAVLEYLEGNSLPGIEVLKGERTVERSPEKMRLE